jgi:hypothetical protein
MLRYRIGVRWLAIIIAAALPSTLAAVVMSPTPGDLQRAIALAHFPHTEDDRIEFHKRYTIPVNGPLVDGWAVERIEVVTEIRRAELMAEEHARLNDSWGRAGLTEVEAALKPWRGRLSIVVHLSAPVAYGSAEPAISLIVDNANALMPIDSRRTDLYANCPDLSGCARIGTVVEQTYAAASIGNAARVVRVRSNGRQLAEVSIDFAHLE